MFDFEKLSVYKRPKGLIKKKQNTNLAYLKIQYRLSVSSEQE